jgi:hypothetical protein
MHAVLAFATGALSAYHLANGNFGISFGFMVLSVINMGLLYVEETDSQTPAD